MGKLATELTEAYRETVMIYGVKAKDSGKMEREDQSEPWFQDGEWMERVEARWEVEGHERKW